MANDARSSLLQMAKGAIQERVDYEVSRVVDNILDMNTEAKVKRKVVLTIVMVPDDDRQDDDYCSQGVRDNPWPMKEG